MTQWHRAADRWNHSLRTALRILTEAAPSSTSATFRVSGHGGRALLVRSGTAGGNVAVYAAWAGGPEPSRSLCRVLTPGTTRRGRTPLWWSLSRLVAPRGPRTVTMLVLRRAAPDWRSAVAPAVSTVVVVVGQPVAALAGSRGHWRPLALRPPLGSGRQGLRRDCVVALPVARPPRSGDHRAGPRRREPCRLRVGAAALAGIAGRHGQRSRRSSWAGSCCRSAGLARGVPAAPGHDLPPRRHPVDGGEPRRLLPARARVLADTPPTPATRWGSTRWRRRSSIITGVPAVVCDLGPRPGHRRRSCGRSAWECWPGRVFGRPGGRGRSAP